MNTKKIDDIVCLIGLIVILGMIAAFTLKLQTNFPLN